MAAPDVFDGMPLEAGTAFMPDGVIYAYVIHEDYFEGKPLVAPGYRFCAVRKAGIKVTSQGPKYVDKELVAAPLPPNWFINPNTFMYENRYVYVSLKF